MREMFLVLFATVALSMSSNAQTRNTGDTDAKKQIRTLTKEFVAGFNSGDLDKMMRLYADKYVDVNLKQPVQTKAERTAYYKSILDRHNTKIKVYPEEIITSGDYAFARGTIVLFHPGKGEGDPKRVQLRYIEVFRKFPAGWKSIWGIDAELYPDKK